MDTGGVLEASWEILGNPRESQAASGEVREGVLRALWERWAGPGAVLGRPGGLEGSLGGPGSLRHFGR